MSYFSRNGVNDAKPHQYCCEYAGGNGRKSAKTYMKKVNRRFVRRSANKQIDNDE